MALATIPVASCENNGSVGVLAPDLVRTCYVKKHLALAGTGGCLHAQVQRRPFQEKVGINQIVSKGAHDLKNSGKYLF